MSWMARSNGGAIFAEATRVAMNSGASLSDTTVVTFPVILEPSES